MKTRSENNPTAENAGKHVESDQSQSEVKQKQTKKIPGLFSTLNWKIALTSGVGF